MKILIFGIVFSFFSLGAMANVYFQKDDIFKLTTKDIISIPTYKSLVKISKCKEDTEAIIVSPQNVKRYDRFIPANTTLELKVHYVDYGNLILKPTNSNSEIDAIQFYRANVSSPEFVSSYDSFTKFLRSPCVNVFSIAGFEPSDLINPVAIQ